MASAKIFRINYKSDFILTLVSDAGWMTPFCIKFWTGSPMLAYYASWDGGTYTNCAPVAGEPTKLLVQFDDHHLPIGDLKFQIAYHFTVADFPNDTEDEVLNQANITTEIDGETYQVMLDFTGETAPEIQFSLPAYANEAQRIANEQQRIENEQQRIANEEARIAAETVRQQNEAQRIQQESARVTEFATLKSQSQDATSAANTAAALANEKAQLAADKAALADDAATLANAKAQLAADKAALADAAATLANDKAALAQQKAEYAQQQGGYAKDQGDYAKNQGDYAKEQGDTALADHQRAEADHGIAVDDHTQAGNDHTRAESDHGIAVDDHTQAGNDHTRAESDHGIAVDDHTQAGNDHTRAESDHGIAADDHTQAGNDHTRAESDHTRAESDHAAVELYVDSLGVFDLSKHNAVGGVLATYADLSAALTALNALDSQYKYGGMSFKFVQSSDNNSTQYVQYRYMSDDASTAATFTNPANWQGVDDEPTVGSDNLVKSGGVADIYQELSQEIGKSNEDVSLDLGGVLITGYYSGRVGEQVTVVSGGVRYEPFDLSEYAGYTLEVSLPEPATATSRRTAICDATGKILALYGEGNFIDGPKTFQIGENQYLYLSRQQNKGYSAVVLSYNSGIKKDILNINNELDGISGEIDELEVNTNTSIDNLSEDITEVKSHITTYTKGVVLNTTGKVVENEDGFLTDFVPVVPQGNYYFANGGLNSSILGLYDENKSFVDYYNVNSTRSLIIPEGIMFVRMSGLLSDIGNAYIEDRRSSEFKLPKIWEPVLFDVFEDYKVSSEEARLQTLAKRSFVMDNVLWHYRHTITADGSLTTSTYAMVSNEFIDISNCNFIDFSVVPSSTLEYTFGVCFYDENKNFIVKRNAVNGRVACIAASFVKVTVAATENGTQKQGESYSLQIYNVTFVRIINTNKYEYDGELLCLRPTLNWEILATLEHSGGVQGSCCYGDILFVFHAMDKSLSYTPCVEVFDLSKRKKTQEIAYGELFGEATPHHNSVNFGINRYSESDSFPLIYTCDFENPVIYVLRVLGNYGEYSLQIVQTINIPSSTDGTAYTQYTTFIDAKGFIYVGGSSGSPRNKVTIDKYALPTAPSESGTYESVVTIPFTDRLNTFEIPRTNPYGYSYEGAEQGGVIYGEKLYWLMGHPLPIGAWLNVIDLEREEIVTTIPFSAIGLNYEPEGAFIYNNMLGVNFNTSNGPVVGIRTVMN